MTVEADRVPVADRRNPYDVQTPGTFLGDYVSTPLGHRGRVYQVHFGCPEGEDWQQVQAYDVAAVTAHTVRWCSVLVHEGGAVVLPETLLQPTEPFVLDNQSALLYFGEGQRNGKVVVKG